MKFFKKLGILVFSVTLLSACSIGSTETFNSTSNGKETVRLTDPYNSEKSLTVLSKELQLSEDHVISVPLGWSDSLFLTPMGPTAISVGDSSTWRTTYLENNTSLSLPLINETSLRLFRLPAKNSDAERFQCDVLRPVPAPLFGDASELSSEPECFIPSIDFAEEDLLGVKDEFENIDSAVNFALALESAEEKVLQRLDPALVTNIQLENSKDNDFALFFVTYSNNPSLNYGGIAFTTRDLDGVAKSYTVVRLVTAGEPILSLEELRSTPEFSILQSFKKKEK